MTQEIINIGSSPNDGAGDPLRTAFAKINNNFSQLFATKSGAAESYTLGTDTQVIFEVPVATFTQGRFEINSASSNTQISQNVSLSSAISNDQLNVKFSAFGAIFNGNPLANFDMDVQAETVRILCTPLLNDSIQHYIQYQIGFVGDLGSGLGLGLDGYDSSTAMATQSETEIVTNP